MTNNSLQVVVTNDIDEVTYYVNRGFCPVECSIGGQSIVDNLVMDHHGEYSHLESVAVRAYRDLYGARTYDPRFVIVGCADADATFAVAALAGLLPHPKRPRDERQDATVWTRNLTDLAETVARIDTDPIGVRVSDLSGGDILLAWSTLAGGARDSATAVMAVMLWVALTSQRTVGPLIAAAAGGETERFTTAAAELDRCGTYIDGVLVVDGSAVWGFDVWYGRNDRFEADNANGWRDPIVLSRTVDGNVTVGCPNKAVAEKLFGPGGLRNVFPQLQPHGWGGRETIGGSPRGATISDSELREAAAVVAAARVD
jgi:hypothetical protein